MREGKRVHERGRELQTHSVLLQSKGVTDDGAINLPVGRGRVMFSQWRIQTETPVEGLHVHQLSPPPDSPGTAKDNTFLTHTNKHPQPLAFRQQELLAQAGFTICLIIPPHLPDFRPLEDRINSIFVTQGDRHTVNPALHFLPQVKMGLVIKKLI